MDIAHLGLAVDSQPVAKAAGDLDRISAAAKRAEQAATGMSDRVSAAGRRVEASNTAVAASANRVAASVSRMSAPISQVEAAYDRATMAAKRFVVANDNAASFRRRNLTYQLFDVGQMAALGQNPAMLLMQQGPQIAQIYAGNGGVNAAFKDLGAILGGIATKIGPLAALAGIAAAGFFGLQQAIQDATGEAVSFGDTFKAVFQVIGGYIYDELEPAITAIAPYFEAAWEAVKEYTADAFNFIVATVVSQAQLVGAGAQAIVIGWQAAYDIIKTVWNNLPQIMGDLTIQAAQLVVDGTETMINEAIGLINKLIETANIALTAVGMDGIKALSDVDFGEITNPWKGEAAATADAIKKRFGEAAADVDKAFTEAGKKASAAFNTDFAGSFFDDVSQQAVKNMEDRLRDLKKEAKEAKDAAAELKRQFEAFQGRADNLLADFFPGEAARREAHELMALLDQFGGQLDDMQRKAVEMRIDELFTAAAMGLRDLNGETRKGRNNLSDMEKEARRLEDALKDAASNFLQDLFTGKDVLESIVQLGSRFASMNFDKFVDMVSGSKGLGGLFGGSGKATPASRADVVSFAKVIGLEVGGAVGKSINDYVAKGGVGAGLSAGSSVMAKATGVAIADGVKPVLARGMDQQIQTFMAALRQVESSNNYSARGPMTSYGRPLGAYQVLPENVTRWSQEFLGRAVTAGEWMKDAAIQDKVVAAKLADIAKKFPDMKDWAAIWNSGRPLSQSANIKDQVFGTSVSSYVDRVMGQYGNLGGAVEAGAKAGTAAGAEIGIGSALDPGTASATTPQQQQNGLGKFMGYASSALGGFSTGYQSQNAGMGALGGFLQGFGATGNILGGIVGGIAGLLGGIFGARNALRQAQRQLEKQMAQINILLAVGEGTGVGAIQKKIADYTAETDKVVPLAWKAEDMKLVERLHQAVNSMIRREATDFYNALPGMIEGYRSGYGRQGASQQGAEAVFSLREELRAMIADVRYFGQQRIDATTNSVNKQWWLDNYGQERWEQELAGAQANAEKTLADAYEAARQMALAFITGTDELTDVQKAIGSLNGAAATLVPTLVELGMTAEDAGAIIQSQVVEAMKKLKQEFEDGLTADINSATDKGYLNDFKDLFEQLEDVRADAARLGTSGALVDDWFKAMAQSVVDGAQLVGTSFEQLIDAFPQLEGVVHEFIEGLEDAGTRLKDYEDRLFAATTDTSTMAGALAAFDREANREREREAAAGGEHLILLERVLAAERAQIMQDFLDQIAARRLGYQNRAFAATNDTSTLAGQLAAFDRAAAQERIEEMKQGGEAIADLDRALAAERLKIISDFNKQAADEEKRRLEEAQSFWESWSRSIKEFVDHQRAGPQSPLSPEARLAEAQANFAEQYAKALTGDRDAANSITSYASDLIEAGEAFWGSTMDFQNLWNSVLSQLEALPDQVSAEQFIVDEITEAIETATGQIVDATQIMKEALAAAFAAGPVDTAAALAVYFDQLDTSVNGLLDFNEFKAGLVGVASDAELKKIFNEIDLNGDANISRLESMLAAEGLTRTAVVNAINSGPASTANLLATHFNKLDTSINGLLDFNELKTALSGSATDAQIRELMTTLDANGDGQLSLLELIKGSTGQTVTNLDANTGVIKQLADLRAITQEKFTGLNDLVIGLTTRAMNVLNSSNVLAGGTGGFMAGGYTGDGAVNAVAGAVHRREYVFDAAATARWGVNNLEMMRRGGMPVMRYGVNDNGNAALIAAVNRLEARLAAIEKHAADTPVAVRQGAAHLGDKLDEVVEATEAGTAAQERVALKRTG